MSGEPSPRPRGWESARLEELASVALAGGLVWRPVRSRFGIRAFGVNAYESEAPGRLVVEEHDESSGGAGGHEELYVVLRGRATFTIDGRTSDAPAGTLLFIADPALRRSAVAEEEGTVVLAVGGEAGRAFEVSPWEAYFGALPDLRAGRFEAAIATMREGLAAHPGHPALLYNLACAESRGGHGDEAVAHLREALDADPAALEAALADADFAPIRERADFPARER